MVPEMMLYSFHTFYMPYWSHYFWFALRHYNWYSFTLARFSWVHGGTTNSFCIFWYTTYVHAANYDHAEQPLLNREVRGRLGTRPRLATLVQIGSQSTVALQYLVLVQYCRGAAGITGYKFRRRCTAMVWLALTNALTRLDLGHTTNWLRLFFRRSSIPVRVA